MRNCATLNANRGTDLGLQQFCLFHSDRLRSLYRNQVPDAQKENTFALVLWAYLEAENKTDKWAPKVYLHVSKSE